MQELLNDIRQLDSMVLKLLEQAQTLHAQVKQAQLLNNKQ
jgi:hypothetical protein